MEDFYIGRPWPEVEAKLRSEGAAYTTVMTYPTKHFFRTDETQLYVLRERRLEDGSLEIVLAAKCVGVDSLRPADTSI
ncbi:MAG: RNA-3-phosphate cyclase [Selenomonadaceae bacterium]|nr:RNA-3-phosphate cyclase [Selenomonadaceae bacterium]